MTSPTEAVYFHPDDYATAGRRIAAFILDHVLLFGLLLGICLVLMVWAMVEHPLPAELSDPTVDLAERNRISREWMRSEPVIGKFVLGFYGWLFLGVLYYTVVRRLRGGTLGYRLAGIRLVDATGNPPSLGVLAKRFVLAVIATLPLGASYALCARTSRRQSFHDRWCGTWLVRKRAVPAGRAVVAFRSVIFRTTVLNYTDVEPADAESTAPARDDDGPS